jgi:hypothetical protein
MNIQRKFSKGLVAFIFILGNTFLWGFYRTDYYYTTETSYNGFHSKYLRTAENQSALVYNHSGAIVELLVNNSSPQQIEQPPLEDTTQNIEEPPLTDSSTNMKETETVDQSPPPKPRPVRIEFIDLDEEDEYDEELPSNEEELPPIEHPKLPQNLDNLLKVPEPPKKEFFWTYLNGNLRSFVATTGRSWKNYATKMKEVLNQTEIIEMYTWETFEHTQVLLGELI